MAVRAEAVFTGGDVHLTNRAAYQLALARQGWADGTDIAITVDKPTRSQRANAYYWGVVLDMIERHVKDQTGYTAEDLHDVFCQKFINCERKRVQFFSELTGELIEADIDPRRSSALTGGKFYDFVEKVRQFAAEFWGLDIEDPDPSYWRYRKGEKGAA